MEIVFKIKKENLRKVKEKLLRDETVSKASIVFKEAESLGFNENDYYCYVSGLDEACNKAKELMKDLGEIIEKKNKEKIISRIKEEEESAATAFGDIFG